VTAKAARQRPLMTWQDASSERCVREVAARVIADRTESVCCNAFGRFGAGCGDANSNDWEVTQKRWGQPKD